jgi:hypothetical protein
MRLSVAAGCNAFLNDKERQNDVSAGDPSMSQ